MRVSPFTVLEPHGSPRPVVVEIPHAGILVDPESLSSLAATGYSIGRDADLYVDELYENATKFGATVLCANISRYVCDLNRSATDIDPLTVCGGAAPANPHGLIWRSATDGSPALVRAPLPYAELERRLTAFYHPYHRALRDLLATKQSQFGFVILLCGHSMPSRSRAGYRGSGRTTLRADLVPGTRHRTTAAAAIIDITDKLAHDHRLSLSHDNPYSGGFTTAHYGRPQHGVHAIQLEVSRRLYMDEDSLKKGAGFSDTRALCDELVSELCRTDPRRPSS